MKFGDEAMKSRDSDFSHRENAAGESIQSRILNLHVVSLGENRVCRALSG